MHWHIYYSISASPQVTPHNYNSCDMLLDNDNTLYSYHTTLSFKTSINYTSGYSSTVTSSHFEFKCNPLHFFELPEQG